MPDGRAQITLYAKQTVQRGSSRWRARAFACIQPGACSYSANTSELAAFGCSREPYGGRSVERYPEAQHQPFSISLSSLISFEVQRK